MRNQWKLSLLVLFVLVGGVSAVLWRTQARVMEDNVKFLSDSSLKQVALFHKLIERRLNDEKRSLVNFAAFRSTRGQGRAQDFGSFAVVARLQRGSSGQWVPSWIEKGPDAKAERWPAGYETTLLKSLAFAKVKDGDASWVRLSDIRGEPIFALMFTVVAERSASASSAEANASNDVPDDVVDSNAIDEKQNDDLIVGFFSDRGPLASLTDEAIGMTTKLFLVDDKGYVAAHVEKSQSGMLFSEDPIVKEIQQRKAPEGAGEFKDLEGQPVVGAYQRVKDSNLFAVATTYKSLAVASANEAFRTGLLAAILAGAFGLLATWLLGRTWLKSLDGAMEPAAEPMASPIEIAATKPETAKVSTEDQVTQVSLISKMVTTSDKTKNNDRSNSEITPEKLAERLADERRSAFQAFNEGFAATLKEPLLSILGHVQLAKAKAEQESVKSHAESIEREARRAKDVIERLDSLGGKIPELMSDDKMDLLTIVHSAIQSVKNDFAADGIEIETECERVPLIRGHAGEIEAALVHMLENSSEAMQARPEKKLRVQLKFIKDRIYVIIGDTGVGMSRDVRENAFQPFFKGFESPKRMGLGLAFVQTALKRHGAECDIESAPGDGTVFTLKFKVTTDEKAAFQSEGLKKLANEVDALFKKPVPPIPPPTSLEADDSAETKASVANNADDGGADDDDDVVRSLPLKRLVIDQDTNPQFPPLPPPIEPRDDDHKFDSDDDDDEDHFSSMSISMAARKPAAPPATGPAVTAAAPVEQAAGFEAPVKPNFQVKIRRPKPRL